ncbi:hypothetical protein [Acinetobacter silvestris]|uniref:Uncharacterized protein n=1 Tax=Acinetobacter silvestris TaxID=1977882 RepID=A0A1Y3CD01_9GAMM|nr:hypothetical protein [Acinetobacter silvestris]OTG63831.1 hypothetical protein B9T28_12635 [Acinetobacter silvestris]
MALYFLTHRYQSIDQQSGIVLVVWRLQDDSEEYATAQVIKIVKQYIQIIGMKILVMGRSSKENCLDIRVKFKREFAKKYEKLSKEKHIFYDLKYVLDKKLNDIRL